MDEQEIVDISTKLEMSLQNLGMVSPFIVFTYGQYERQMYFRELLKEVKSFKTKEDIYNFLDEVDFYLFNMKIDLNAMLTSERYKSLLGEEFEKMIVNANENSIKLSLRYKRNMSNVSVVFTSNKISVKYLEDLGVFDENKNFEILEEENLERLFSSHLNMLEASPGLLECIEEVHRQEFSSAFKKMYADKEKREKLLDILKAAIYVNYKNISVD